MMTTFPISVSPPISVMFLPHLLPDPGSADPAAQALWSIRSLACLSYTLHPVFLLLLINISILAKHALPPAHLPRGLLCRRPNSLCCTNTSTVYHYKLKLLLPT